jgi:hypothetical protein
MWSGITVTRCTDKVSECGGGTSRSTVLARSSFVPPLTLRPSLPTIVVNVVKRLACDYYHLRTISGQPHTSSEPGPLRHRDFSSIPALDVFQWSCLSEASKLRISDALSHDLVDPMSASVQKLKSSMGAYVFRSAPNNGHRATTAACPFRARSGSTPFEYQDFLE